MILFFNEIGRDTEGTHLFWGWGLGIDNVFNFRNVQFQSENVAKVQVEDDKDLSQDSDSGDGEEQTYMTYTLEAGDRLEVE